MNDDKLNELLNNADPPKIDLPKHKADLRRSLLTSDKFNRGFLMSLPASREILLGGVFSVIIAAIIFFNIPGGTGMDRDELINPIKQSYAGFLAPGNINYFNSGLTIFGDNNESLDVEVEKWIDKTNDRYNLLVKDILSGETLDEIIITDGVLYKMENPRLQAFNTAGTLRKVVLHLTQDMVTDYQTPGDSAEYRITTQIDDELGLLENSGLIVYHSNPNVSNEVNINDESINKMKVNNSVNLNEYYKDNPVDILDELIAADSISYKGTFTDGENGIEYNEIVMHSEVTVQDMQKILVRMQDSISGWIETETESDTAFHNSHKYFKVSIGDSTGSADSICNQHEELKTVKVNTETGEIIEVTYSIASGDNTSRLAVSRFNKQTVSAGSDEDRFNHAKKGLVAVGSRININSEIIHLK